MKRFLADVGAWLWATARDLIVNYLYDGLVEWLLDRVRALCENFCAQIANYQRAHADELDDDTARQRILVRLGEGLAAVGAHLIERAPSMSEQDAIELFEQALDPDAVLA